MTIKWLISVMGVSLCCFTASAAYCGNDAAESGNAPIIGAISDEALAQVVPGQSTKAQIQSLLGTPWRTLQFNDCGEAMDDEADETWDYRGKDSNGTYRVHIEFDNQGVTHLVAKIPDNSPGGKPTVAKVAPAQSAKKSMQM
jgi:outer membrane protein assembly factor BamE (lipoprotein component of BamABCDE complex)